MQRLSRAANDAARKFDLAAGTVPNVAGTVPVTVEDFQPPAAFRTSRMLSKTSGVVADQRKDWSIAKGLQAMP
jgi:hypothetical protein